MHSGKIWTLAIISVIFFMVINAPAQLIKPYLKNSISFPFNVSGTVWNGSLQSQYFNDSSWQVNPAKLLLAKISFAIQLEVDSKNKLNLDLIFSPFSKLELANINGVLTTEYLQQFVPNTPFLISAELNLLQANAKWIRESPPVLPSDFDISLTLENVNFLGENLGSYDLNLVYFDRLLDGNIFATDNSSLINTSLKINLSRDYVLSVKGNIFPKEEHLKAIFNDLNISNNLDLSYKLNPNKFIKNFSI